MQPDTNSSTPLAHRIDDACRRIGIGRTMIYELIAAGELKAIRLGNRTLIPESELQRFITERMSRAA